MKLIHDVDETTIQINDGIYDFSDFLKFNPSYTVPYGMPSRVYERGVCHYITDGRNTLYLPLIDSVCDKICSREGEFARLVRRLQQERIS